MNKTSKTFQDTIKAYLDQRAASDELFAKSYAKESKNIEECCNYIVSEVQKMKVNGMADDEVYSLAVHYYDEDDLGDIKANYSHVVVNHAINLSEEDIAKAKLEAMKRIEEEEYARLQKGQNAGKSTHSSKRQQSKSGTPNQSSANTRSLFDFE